MRSERVCCENSGKGRKAVTSFQFPVPSFTVQAGWLVDGSGRPARKNVLVRIENGKICSIGSREEAPPASDSMDLSHCTLLPGLVDCHVHLFMSGTTDLKARNHQLSAGYEEVRDVIAFHLARHRSRGVMAVRDGGDRQGYTQRYRRRFMGDGKSFPILQAAGRAWHKPGRYGKLIGRTACGFESLAAAIEAEPHGIDCVKIVNSGLNSLVQFGRQTAAQFDLLELQEAVEAARKRGWEAMVHANGELPVRIALEAGCRSVEHGFFMGVDNLKRMAEREAFWIPTAVAMKAYADYWEVEAREPGQNGADAETPLPGRSADVARQTLEHQLEQISRARELGVSIAVGTDSGSMGVHHGEAVIEEMKLLVKAGFTLEEAVRSATYQGARLLGLDGYGLLAPGRPAVFLAVKGDPSGLPDSLNVLERFYIDKL